MEKTNNISAVNSFDGGMVADLHVLTSPSNTTVYALNMELVTIGDNQYIFQNIKGNKHVVDLPKYLHSDSKEYAFIPLGLKVRNNIAYILVGAFKPSGEFITGGIGTFPSPDWTALNNPLVGSSTLRESFSFLHNYKKFNSSEPNKPFISTKFGFEKNRFIDMEIQGDFDGSVNIIFTDNKNSPSIINSRFSRVETSSLVRLANRLGNNDSNVYSEEDWDRIALIQNNNFPISFVDKDGAIGEGFDVLDGGYLKGGGYRYFLKYSTQEGNTTEILYESPLIPIANGGLGLTKDQVSDKLVRFYLKDLDSSYSGIKVYFAHFSGDDAASMDLYKINYTFSYSDSSFLVINHTGLEDVTPVDISEINIGFTPIDTIKTSVIINDRLALAGISSTISEQDVSILSEAAKSVTLWEKSTPIKTSYADPNTASKTLGYWKCEVYEFAIVYMLVKKGLSPAFPITGMDNRFNSQAGFSNSAYPNYTLDSDGFSSDGLLINNKGLFRTSETGDIYKPEAGGEATRYVTYLEANCSSITSNIELNKLVTGFFIVRRQRIKNVLLQGMAVPTLRLPSKPPSIPDGVGKGQFSLSASKRYLSYYYSDFPTIGLNAPYTSTSNPVTGEGTISDPIVVTGEAHFNDDFDTVLVPQPTQVINVITQEKSWPVVGGIGQAVKSPDYGISVDKDGKSLNKLHVAFYSCEIEMNLPAIKGYLNGINPEVEIQGLKNNVSPVGYTTLHTDFVTKKPVFKTKSNIIVRNAEVISMDRAAWVTLPAQNVRATLLDSGVASFSSGGFTAKIDKSLGFVARNITEAAEEDSPIDVNYTFPYRESARSGNVTRLYSNSNVLYYKRHHYFSPYSTIGQSYSRYMGLEISSDFSFPLPTKVFSYATKVESTTINLPNKAGILIDSTEDVANRKFVNLGHLANVFRSSTGRWSQDDIRNIYKYDSSKVYHASTNRLPIGVDKVSIFRGDGFISRIFKRVTYKNGVLGSKSATAADAGDYGVGLITDQRDNVDVTKLGEIEKNDAGRGLVDVGQIIELATYSNINADIRSIEILSPEDSLLYGGDRNFYPNKLQMFGDARPDSVKYNHGYTGDYNPIVYNRIEDNIPYLNTEFPNRILLSERNKTQNFFNAFRDLKGFNYRDYGVELGPIVKLIAIKNVLLSVHPTGVLLIGVDDRTLVAEGSTVFVNTAQALSPTAKTISDVYGSTNPESIVKTDTTVAGVDFTSSAVWLFEGEKLSIISEFAIKTVLEKFKKRITSGGFKAGDSAVIYEPRIYSTFNMTKHVLYISYVAENSMTKEQIHVGTVTYSTVLQKWMSEISEGNKFIISTGAVTYTTGFSDVVGVWKEDSLIKDGKNVRCNLRGVQYQHIFEIVINKEPALEKILDNIRVITNKSIPVEIVYTTTGDENDAAIDVWGSDPAEKILNQKIFSRENSPRKLSRLGILDENAYYKNSGLYIEVGRIDPNLRKDRGYKRVRDKSIKVKFIYEGADETFLQALISILSISYS